MLFARRGLGKAIKFRAVAARAIFRNPSRFFAGKTLSACTFRLLVKLTRSVPAEEASVDSLLCRLTPPPLLRLPPGALSWIWRPLGPLEGGEPAGDSVRPLPSAVLLLQQRRRFHEPGMRLCWECFCEVGCVPTARSDQYRQSLILINLLRAFPVLKVMRRAGAPARVPSCTLSTNLSTPGRRCFGFLCPLFRLGARNWAVHDVTYLVEDYQSQAGILPLMKA